MNHLDGPSIQPNVRAASGAMLTLIVNGIVGIWSRKAVGKLEADWAFPSLGLSIK